MRIFLLLLFALIVCWASFPAKAQEFAIVAVVNGDAISNYSLYDRIQLMIRSSGLEDTPDIRNRLVPQVVQILINETLQKQHAQTLDITVTEEDVKEAVTEIEQRNGLKPGKFESFVASQKIDKSSLLEQIKSQIIWKKIASRKIHPKLVVSDFEIKDAMDQVKAVETIKEVYLSEIFLPVAMGSDSETLALAKKLVEEIENGKDFASIAKQFSTGVTAEDGGAIGWVKQGQLRGSLRRHVARAEANSVLPPIRTEDGYRIIKVGERRSEAPTVSEEDIVMRLRLQKLELESKRFMKQLRQDAFIEVKL